MPFGLGQAATIRVAYAAGAGDVAALRLTSRVAIGLGFGWSIVGCALMWWLALPIAEVFLDAADPANLPTLEMAAALVAFVALYQLPDGPQQVALGVLRGLRETRVPMIIALISYWIIGAALCVWFGFALGYSGPGVWAGLALALVIATMAVMTRYLWYGERLIAGGRLRVAEVERPLSVRNHPADRERREVGGEDQGVGVAVHVEEGLAGLRRLPPSWSKLGLQSVSANCSGECKRSPLMIAVWPCEVMLTATWPTVWPGAGPAIPDHRGRSRCPPVLPDWPP